MEKQKPDKKFKAGAVTATIWKKDPKDRQGNGFSVYTVSFERTYKDRDGQWKSTSSLRINDIPKLQLVAVEGKGRKGDVVEIVEKKCYD
jgi:hypothetical protein